MRRRLVTALTPLFGAFLAGPVAADEVSKAWLDLWMRCRVAIETATPVNVSGLIPLETTAEIRGDIERRSYDDWRLWGRADSRFAIIDMERKVDGGVQRSCEVSLAPNVSSLTEIEVGLILRKFLIDRANLVAARTHTANELEPIYPLIPLGLSPVNSNPNGCSVISAIFFDISSNFFLSSTGEQIRLKCSGSSKLNLGRMTKPTSRP